MGNGLGKDDSQTYELISFDTPANYPGWTMEWEYWYEDEKRHLDDEGNSYDQVKEWRGDIRLIANIEQSRRMYMGMGIMFSKKSNSQSSCAGFPTQNAHVPYDGIEVYWLFHPDCFECTKYEITDVHTNTEVDFSQGLVNARGIEIDDVNNWAVDTSQSSVSGRKNEYTFSVNVFRQFITEDPDDEDLVIGEDTEFCVYGWYNVYDSDITV